MKLKLGLGSFVVLVLLLGSIATATAWRDRKPPTPPGNLQVTDVGSDYIALDWDASFDRSFNFSYRV